jgi:putative hemin transport protein
MTSAELTEIVRQNPWKMTLQLARELGVGEVEVVRAFPDNRSAELDPACWEELFAQLESMGDLHVIVSNSSVTIEAVGKFGGYSTSGEFFNVQTPSLDMHIRRGEIRALFAVEKPGHLNGVSTFSFQFFDSAGAAVFKVFLNFGGKIAPERKERFDLLKERFPIR